MATKIFVETDDDLLFKRISICLEPLGGSCFISKGSAVNADVDSIRIIDARTNGEDIEKLSHLNINSSDIVVSKEGNFSVCELLQQLPGLEHVILEDKQLEQWQLLPIVRKYVHQYYWGVQQYLKAGSSVKRFVLQRYAEKADVLQDIRRSFDESTACLDFAQVACTLASEMIMNAVFSAPHDFETARPIYQNLPRSSDVVLTEHERPIVSFGLDKKVFAVSVCDGFGMLTKDIVIDSWLRGGRLDLNRREHGAGVGLFSMLSHAHQLDFSIAPHVQTEVVAILKLAPRFRDYQVVGCSVNFFTVEDSED